MIILGSKISSCIQSEAIGIYSRANEFTRVIILGSEISSCVQSEAIGIYSCRNEFTRVIIIGVGF